MIRLRFSWLHMSNHGFECLFVVYLVLREVLAAMNCRECFLEDNTFHQNGEN